MNSNATEPRHVPGDVYLSHADEVPLTLARALMLIRCLRGTDGTPIQVSMARPGVARVTVQRVHTHPTLPFLIVEQAFEVDLRGKRVYAPNAR
jgi:hypothetical protein